MNERVRGELFGFLLLSSTYVLAGKLALRLAFVHANATAVWPPTGIAIAAMLVLGYRVWPAVFAGAFVVNITTQGSIATSIGIATGNTLEGLCAAYLVNRFAHGRSAFERWQDVLRFVLLAGIISPIVSATLGVTSLSLGGYALWVDYRSIWSTWWLGDVGGALVVAPLLMLLRGTSLAWTRAARTEAVVSFLAVGVVSQIVFGGWFPGEVKNYELTYLCFPILVWTALRFGSRETAAANVLLSLVAIGGTLRGYGPFAREGSPNESLLLVQAFMGAAAVFDLGLAAVMSQRRHAEGRREELLDELQRSLERAHSLPGLLPICASCKKIRDENGVWERIEVYVEARWEVRFTHGLCPDCFGELSH